MSKGTEIEYARKRIKYYAMKVELFSSRLSKKGDADVVYKDCEKLLSVLVNFEYAIEHLQSFCPYGVFLESPYTNATVTTVQPKRGVGRPRKIVPSMDEFDVVWKDEPEYMPDPDTEDEDFKPITVEIIDVRSNDSLYY